MVTKNHITKTVNSVGEARDVKKHIEELGFSYQIEGIGTWEPQEGPAVFLGGTRTEIVNLGYKYAVLDLGNEGKAKAKPDENALTEGKIIFTIEE